MQFYTPHHGRIWRQTLKMSGLPIKVIARKLGISRSTLYRRLAQKKLAKPFVKSLQKLILESPPPSLRYHLDLVYFYVIVLERQISFLLMFNYVTVELMKKPKKPKKSKKDGKNK